MCSPTNEVGWSGAAEALSVSHGEGSERVRVTSTEGDPGTKHVRQLRDIA